MDFRSLPMTLEEVLKLARVKFSNRDKLPAESGIYFVLYGDAPGRIAYIGRAKSFRHRWIGHHRVPEFVLLTKLGIPSEIAWIAVDEDELKAAERSLIAIFTPPLNDGPTLKVSRSRSVTLRDPPNAEDIVEEFRARRDGAIELLTSEDFWNTCNDRDGDLLTVWPFANGAKLIELDMHWTCHDNHGLNPPRIVEPPSFSANESGVAEPKEDYEASWTERFAWTLDVARQVDSFLIGIVAYHSAGLKEEIRQLTFALILDEPGVEGTLRSNPELLDKLP